MLPNHDVLINNVTARFGEQLTMRSHISTLPPSLHARAVAITLMLSLILGVCHAADLDSIREPVIRPNDETVKRWLYNLEIILEKHNLWFDRTAKIEPSKILNLKTSGGSIYQKPPPLANYAITTRSFEYPDGSGANHKYVVVIEYEWSVTLAGIDRKFSKATITGP